MLGLVKGAAGDILWLQWGVSCFPIPNSRVWVQQAAPLLRQFSHKAISLM